MKALCFVIFTMLNPNISFFLIKTEGKSLNEINTLFERHFFRQKFFFCLKIILKILARKQIFKDFFENFSQKNFQQENIVAKKILVRKNFSEKKFSEKSFSEKKFQQEKF